MQECNAESGKGVARHDDFVTGHYFPAVVVFSQALDQGVLCSSKVTLVHQILQLERLDALGGGGWEFAFSYPPS